MILQSTSAVGILAAIKYYVHVLTVLLRSLLFSRPINSILVLGKGFVLLLINELLPSEHWIKQILDCWRVSLNLASR